MGPGDAVFVGEQLKGLGLPGAIIIVLMAVAITLGGVIFAMWKHSNKVYGYRLQERDTLNKALTDSSKVLADMQQATEERNDLTQDQADLLNKQSAAFEVLKVTILAQYDTIKSNDLVVAQTVTAMAEAIRVLTSIVTSQGQTLANHVQELKNAITAACGESKAHSTTSANAVIAELRRLLADTTIVRRRKISK